MGGASKSPQRVLERLGWGLRRDGVDNPPPKSANEHKLKIDERSEAKREQDIAVGESAGEREQQDRYGCAVADQGRDRQISAAIPQWFGAKLHEAFAEGDGGGDSADQQDQHRREDCRSDGVPCGQEHQQETAQRDECAAARGNYHPGVIGNGCRASGDRRARLFARRTVDRGEVARRFEFHKHRLHFFFGQRLGRQTADPCHGLLRRRPFVRLGVLVRFSTGGGQLQIAELQRSVGVNGVGHDAANPNLCFGYDNVQNALSTLGF